MLTTVEEFAEEIKNTGLEERECITSFDVTALFISIPVAAAIEVIKGRLEQDTELPKRTTLSTDNILELLEFCLNNTYFLFQNQYFEQNKGAAMGSPVSPIVANIYIGAFEDTATNTALHPPKIWRRYVDDTFVVQQKSHKEEFFQHINEVDTSIKFTMEEAGPDGSIPFLDVLVTPKVDGTFTTKVYRKPTHTDQHLQWDSNHNLASKYNVINTLTHRVRTLCSTPELISNELEHLEEVLRGCKYPRWAIKKILQNKNKRRPTERGKISHQLRRDAILWFHIVKVSVKALKNICQRYGIQIHFKGGAIFKNLLVSPKDKESITKKSSVIYWFKCDKIDCEEEYLGESSRTFGERCREHLKAPSPIYEHQNNTGHTTSVENFKIIGREGGPQYGRNSKRGHVHPSEQSHIEQEHLEVQPATPLGWNIAFHSRVED